MVTKDMDILEVTSSTILEFDTEEVTDIRRRTTAEFDGESRSVVGYKEGQRIRLPHFGIIRVTDEFQPTQGARQQYQFGGGKK